MDFYSVLTTVGQAVLANAGALGQTINLSHMAVGDGNGSTVTPSETATALVNEVYRGSLNSLSTDPDNPNWLIAELVIPTNVGGWTVHEVGLFDGNGNLFAYGNFPETYKPQLSEGASRDLVIRMVLQISGTANVELKIDPAVVLATRDYADIVAQVKIAEHEAATNPHPQYGYNPNRLINGGFQVWQRGESPTLTIGAYTADRWKVDFSIDAADNVTISKESDALQVAITNASETVNLGQVIEHFTAESGEIYTLSFEARLISGANNIVSPFINESGILKAAATNPAAYTSVWQRFIYHYTFNNDFTGNLPLFLCSDFGTGDNTFQFRKAKFECGSIATPFEYSNYTTEVLKCQRYYKRIKLNDIRFIEHLVDNVSEGIARFIYPMGVPMRTASTLVDTIPLNTDFLHTIYNVPDVENNMTVQLLNKLVMSDPQGC
ncbi:MAG: phage tail protein, partial [Lentisphaerae bacterium]|nr:phage tail protein [Lentisphaerota bacterium]